MKKITILIAVAAIAASVALAEETPDYLSFTATGGDVTIGMKWSYGTPTATHTFEWSADKSSWTDFVSGSSNMTVHAGETVYFRRKGDVVTTLNPGESGYSWQFTMTPAEGATIAAGGNVMSLLDASCLQTEVGADAFSFLFYGCTALTAAPKLPATTLATRCFYGMFYDCTALTAAPELPATTLAEKCYGNMFYKCTALTAAPKLSATTLAANCYNDMFYGCTALTAAPDMPAMTMAANCYNGMFCGCTALTAAPELPATTLAANCYMNMFSGCTALGWIKVGFTEWSRTATSTWVSRVPAGGLFVCPSELDDQRGVHEIPDGWTKTTADSVRFVTVPKVAHLKTAVTMNGNAVTPLAAADSTRWPVVAGAAVRVTFSADAGYAVEGDTSYSIDPLTSDVSFGTTVGYPTPRVQGVQVPVLFQKGVGVDKIFFACEGSTDFIEFPSEGTNLMAGTEIDIRVTTGWPYCYDGNTHFSVSGEGLEKTISATRMSDVKFTAGIGVEKIEFKCNGKGEFVDFPSEGTNLMADTEIKLQVTPETNYRYTGETLFTVQDAGLDVTIDATEIAPGDVERPWAAGDDVTVYTNGTTLVIVGSGAMNDFASAAEVPWVAVADQVTAVTVADGVTQVGKNALAGIGDIVPVNGTPLSTYRTVSSVETKINGMALDDYNAAVRFLNVGEEWMEARSASPVPPVGAVMTWTALTNAVATAAAGAEIAVGADITEANGELTVPKGKEVAIKLYGKTVSCGSVTVGGSLTVGDAEDLVGKIVASDGAKITSSGLVTLLGGPVRGTFTTQNAGLIFVVR